MYYRLLKIRKEIDKFIYMEKLNKTFFLFYVSILLIISVFIFGVFIFPRTIFAWQVDSVAESVCVLNRNVNINYVNIKVTFTNKEDKVINVVAKDNWTDQEVDLGTISPNETKEGLIKTGQTSITNSSVTFFLKWADGQSGSQEITVKYNALECTQPTPSITVTQMPTVTLTPTPMPIPTFIPSQTPTPLPTSIPSVINNVNNNVNANATAANTVNIQQTQPTQVQPTPVPQVLAATTIKVLPKTGGSDAILVGLLSLLPLGFYLKKKA